MLAAQKASLNSLLHPNLLQATLLQSKSFSSGWMNPRSWEWDHFIYPTSLYLIAHSTERWKAQTLDWVKVNVSADSHFPILVALYSSSFPSTPVPQSQVLFFCFFLFILLYFLLLFFPYLSFFLSIYLFIPSFYLFPQQNITARWQAFINNVISLTYSPQ